MRHLRQTPDRHVRPIKPSGDDGGDAYASHDDGDAIRDGGANDVDANGDDGGDGANARLS